MAENKMTAYHGTSTAAAASIRREQHFRESKKDIEWLGSGVYFFRYKEHARRWIRNRGLEPGDVLTATLEYEDEELLDLDDPAQLEMLNQAMENLYKVMRGKILIRPGEVHETWKRWCLSCNMYRKMKPKIGLISYTFPQKGRHSASWFPGNERQICVSRHEIITKIL